MSSNSFGLPIANRVVASTAYEASRVLKTASGKLFHLQGYNSKGSAQFIQLHDLSAVPSNAVSGVAEVSTISFEGLNAAAVANKYLTLSGASANYYVWFNVNAAGTDPEVAGKTAIEVAVATGANATAIADATAAAINAEADFGATHNGHDVTITDAATGARTDIGAGNSGATVAVSTQGVTAISAAVPKFVITVAASSNFSFAIPVEGIPFSNGIVVCNSSTGPTKTAGSADCFFSAVIS